MKRSCARHGFSASCMKKIQLLLILFICSISFTSFISCSSSDDDDDFYIEDGDGTDDDSDDNSGNNNNNGNNTISSESPKVNSADYDEVMNEISSIMD